MGTLRLPLRLYVVAAMCAAVIGVTYGGAVSREPEPADVVPFLVLAALAAAAERWPAHLTAKTKVVVSDAATFAAALVLPAPLAMLAAGGAVVVSRIPGPWFVRGFNASVAALGTGAAALTYVGIAGPGARTIGDPLAIVAAAVAKYLVSAGLVDAAVGLLQRRNPLSMWWAVHRRDLPQHAALYLLGLLAALSAATHPWALAVFAAPMFIVLFNLRESSRLRQQTRQAILELADLVDMRDPYTYGHSERVSELAARLARRMGLEHSQVELVREGGRLHDIGKIGTDDHVLHKPGPLTEEELAAMRKHSEFGAKLLRTLPEFWEGATLVLAHHERYDGKGYPRGLSGEEVPMEASIIAVCDAYDAMSSDRPYRKALPWVTVRGELVRGRGTHWNPRVLDAFVAMIDDELAVSAPLARREPATA